MFCSMACARLRAQHLPHSGAWIGYRRLYYLSLGKRSGVEPAHHRTDEKAKNPHSAGFCRTYLLGNAL
jgi:hypothetical protein